MRFSAREYHELQHKIFDALKLLRKPATLKEIQYSMMGKSPTVKKCLSSMAKIGLVETVKNGKTKLYRLPLRF